MTKIHEMVDFSLARMEKLKRIGCGFEAEIEMWVAVLNEARRLAEEEAKEKPTPAEEYLEHARKHPVPDIPSAPALYMGNPTVKSCNCIGPINCKDMACSLVNNHRPASQTGLVWELEYLISRDFGTQPDDDAVEVEDFWIAKINGIISRYRPTSQTGLVEELREWVNKNAMRGFVSASQEVKEIISRHSKDTEPLADEIVLESGEMSEDFMMYANNAAQEHYGKRGQLIFRPTKADREAK